MSDINKPCKNTDTELYREPAEIGMEAYAPSIFVTKEGGIGINVGGRVFVKSLSSWHHAMGKQVELEAMAKKMFPPDELNLCV